MKRIILTGIVVIGSLFFVGCGPDRSGSEGEEHDEHEHGAETIAALNEAQLQAVGIQIGTIELKKLNASMTLVGRLEVPNDSKANITSLYGGVVQRLNVQVGSAVKKGQVVATIVDPTFIQLQEEYLTLESRITFAEQEMKRQRELNAGNAGTLRNLQQAEADLNALQTRQASLHQQLRLMGIDPVTLTKGNLQSSLRVTSPISGIVSSVFTKVGSYVDVSSPVAEVVNNNDIHADLNVYEKDLPSVQIGQSVSFSLANSPGRVYEAEVFSVGAAFEGDGKSVPVHCVIKGDKTGLIDGMAINAQISHEDAEGPAVPNEAIVAADGKDFIFVVTEEDGHTQSDAEPTVNFEKIEIAKGESSMGYTAITPVTELPVGTKVAVKGAFFIHAKLSGTGGHDH